MRFAWDSFFLGGIFAALRFVERLRVSRVTRVGHLFLFFIFLFVVPSSPPDTDRSCLEIFYAFGERRFSTTFWGTNSPTPKSHLNSLLFHFPANLSEMRNFTKKKPRLLKEERIPRTRVVRCVPSRRTRDASWMRRGSLSTHIVEIQRLCTLILPIVTSHGKTFPKR